MEKSEVYHIGIHINNLKICLKLILYIRHYLKIFFKNFSVAAQKNVQNILLIFYYLTKNQENRCQKTRYFVILPSHQARLNACINAVLF